MSLINVGFKYGVDISYKLVKLGGCNPKEFPEEEPIVRENVHDKTILLDDLHPGSEYEVTGNKQWCEGLRTFQFSHCSKTSQFTRQH